MLFLDNEFDFVNFRLHLFLQVLDPLNLFVLNVTHLDGLLNHLHNEATNVSLESKPVEGLTDNHSIGEGLRVIWAVVSH